MRIDPFDEDKCLRESLSVGLLDYNESECSNHVGDYATLKEVNRQGKRAKHPVEVAELDSFGHLRQLPINGILKTDDSIAVFVIYGMRMS